MTCSCRSRRLAWLALASWVASGCLSAWAHKVSAVSVVAEFHTKDRSFKVELAMDVDPSGDPTIDDQIPPEEAAHAFATESLVIFFDDAPVSPEPEIRVLTASDEDTPAELQRKKVIGTLKGTYPEGAEHFLLQVDESTEAAVVMVTIKDQKPSRRLQVLYPGEFSNPLSLATRPASREGGDDATANPEESRSEDSESTETVTNAEALPPPPGMVSWIKRGFEAILPHGVDFWAFMLAMFALSLRSKPLGWQLALYTSAHSLALALAAFKLLDLPPLLVAAVVAIGPLVLAIDNLFHQRLVTWRGVAVFVFGLFHGMALATILWDGAPRISTLLPALVGFNVGIECAQFLVLAGASLVAAWLHQKSWFRPWVVHPLCILLAGIAVYRLVEVLWLGR